MSLLTVAKHIRLPDDLHGEDLLLFADCRRRPIVFWYQRAIEVSYAAAASPETATVIALLADKTNDAKATLSEYSHDVVVRDVHALHRLTR
jgi:hypothetical protein